MVGNDYVQPRQSAAAVRTAASDCGVEVLVDDFVPLGCGDFSGALEGVERCGCDGLLLLLVGEDVVRSNRVFAAAGLDRIARLSPLMARTCCWRPAPRARAGSEGMTLLAHLAERAGTLDVAALEALADQVLPRGTSRSGARA